jgi:hypothetical protein
MVWEWLKWIFGFFWNKRYGHVSTLLHSQTMCKYTKLGSISDTELIHASIDSFENVFGSCLYTIMDFNTLYQPVYHNVAPYHNTKHCNSTNSKIPEFIQNWFQRDVYEHKDIGFIYSSNGCMNLYWKGNRALLNVFKAKGGFGVVYPPYLVHEDLVEKFISGLVTWFDDDTFGDDTTIVNDAIDAIAIDTNTTTNTNNPTNKTNNKLTPKDLLKEE